MENFKYKRILLKLSGEAVAGKDAVLDFDLMDSIARVLIEAQRGGVDVGVIFGAGNIWRGRNGGNMDRVTADRMGMLATVINCLAAKDAIIRAGGKATVMTATNMEPCAEYYSTDRALAAFEEGKIVIFGGGSGCPYFSTDTAGILRAIEIKADVFLLAKNIDGIYDRDPHEPGAKFLETVSYADMMRMGLKGIDLTASAMGAEFGPDAFAFLLHDPQDILRAIRGDCRGTVITK